MNETAINDLIDEYMAWNKAQGLCLGSADEHLFDEDLTEQQRAWLADFCRRWDDFSRRWEGATEQQTWIPGP